jgi:hypothetical protein
MFRIFVNNFTILEEYIMNENQSVSSKEVLDKFGKVIMELVHQKTCQNIQWILSGYSNPNDPDAKLFLEYADLDDKAQSIINKLLLRAVNSTIANFLFMLSDFDHLNESCDSITINSYYTDKEGNKKRIVELYDNWSGLFSCEWLEYWANFKYEIAPENPRNIDRIKIFPNQSENIEDLVHNKQQNQSLSEFDIENMIANAHNETKKEMQYRLGSLYLIKYLTNRFLPNMKPEQWNEIEQIGNHDGDRFSAMFDMALKCQSLEAYIEEIRTRW